MIGSIIDFLFPNEGCGREVAWGKIILITYLGTALYTFGHVGARHPVYDSVWVECQQTVARNGTIIKGTPGEACSVDLTTTAPPLSFMKAAGFGAIWPLYWAWHLQEEAPHDD